MSTAEVNPVAGLDLVHESLTREDAALLRLPQRVLFLAANGSILALFAFMSWVVDFKSGAVLETALPPTLLLFVCANTASAIQWALANRSVKWGGKVIVSGQVTRVEDGPLDDETPVKLVYIGRACFRVPRSDIGDVQPGQVISLHYYRGKKIQLERLLKASVRLPDSGPSGGAQLNGPSGSRTTK